jgi:putative SOS response-associated peptidase YedK
MPLMLSNDAAQQWLQKDLSQEDMKKLMSASVADEQVESYRVMDGIMNARKNTNIPEAIKPLENALGQISLF